MAFILAGCGLTPLRPARHTKPKSVSPAVPQFNVPASALRSPATSDRDRQGFLLARPGYAYRFPRDGGAHPGYKTEWWYYTGHLSDGSRQYGFELTFFRNELQAHPPVRRSHWATNTVYLAHFAITDVSRGTFHFAERIDRGALGTAGASFNQENAWVGSWRACVPPNSNDAAMWPHRIIADANFAKVRLTLTPVKPLTIQGQHGISVKGSGPGQASHYYSYTRMKASGSLAIGGGAPHTVTGMAWMDHEFSSSSLSRDETGWDWFSVQLGDGWDVMLYQLRVSSGGRLSAPVQSISPFSSGTLISPAGHATFLTHRDFSINSDSAWRSPFGATYPASWTIRIPREQLQIHERPAVADQELRSTSAAAVDYWEGLVSIVGTHRGRAVAGEGYTELTGYAGALSELR